MVGRGFKDFRCSRDGDRPSKQRLTAAGHTRVKLKPHQKYWAEVVDIYRAGSPEAARELVRLSTQAEDERVRSVCAGMVMDRAWGKPREYDPNTEGPSCEAHARKSCRGHAP